MKKQTVSSVLISSLLGGLFAPDQKVFPGLGSTVSRSLAAIKNPMMVSIKRVSSDSYELRNIPDNIATGVRADAINDVLGGLAFFINSTLPAGSTKRYAYKASKTAMTGGTTLIGPVTAGVYSLEDLIDTLADGGFDSELSILNTTPASFADGSHLVIDQTTGMIVLFDGSAMVVGGIEGDIDAEVVLSSEAAIWE